MEVDVTERMSINPCIMLIKACVVILSFRQAASHHVSIVVVTRVVNVAVRIDRYIRRYGRASEGIRLLRNHVVHVTLAARHVADI